jgi:hypothetical protein
MAWASVLSSSSEDFSLSLFIASPTMALARTAHHRICNQVTSGQTKNAENAAHDLIRLLYYIGCAAESLQRLVASDIGATDIFRSHTCEGYAEVADR